MITSTVAQKESANYHEKKKKLLKARSMNKKVQSKKEVADIEN